MKTKRIITALAFAALSLTIFAQTPQQRPQMSEEQRMEVKAVREKYSPEIEKLRNGLAIKEAENEVKQIESQSKVNFDVATIDKCRHCKCNLKSVRCLQKSN